MSDHTLLIVFLGAIVGWGIGYPLALLLYALLAAVLRGR